MNPLQDIASDQDVKKEDYQEPSSWTIVTALNRVLEVAEDCSLSDEFWETIKNPLAYLRERLELTNMQIIARIVNRCSNIKLWFISHSSPLHFIID